MPAHAGGVSVRYPKPLPNPYQTSAASHSSGGIGQSNSNRSSIMSVS